MRRAAPRFSRPRATAALTKFVFCFALSAMLFRFLANPSLAARFDRTFVLAYLLGTGVDYLLATLLAFLHGGPVAEGLGPGVVKVVVPGLVSNPMIVAIVLGLTVSALALPLPAPVNAFLLTLGAAATPGALFAIGASLATNSAERRAVAGGLSFAKLALHPAAVAICALWLFPVDPSAAGLRIAAASLPVAGIVYILAQHYGVAPRRISAAILLSTAASVITVSGVIAWVKTNMP